MSARIPVCLMAACVLVLSACGGGALRWDADASSYKVEPGDTLYSIAWRHGLDYRELARWNGLGDRAVIYPGQTLSLKPTASHGKPVRRNTVPASEQRRDDPPPQWHWPTNGSVVNRFGDQSSVGKGIDIGGSEGQPVVAAAEGEVVYTGSGLIRYGKLIIVKHNNTFLSAYGHNSALFVKEGERVRSGQRIASMGEGPGKRPVLHFEIRLNGKPVDPMLYLPKQ